MCSSLAPDGRDARPQSWPGMLAAALGAALLAGAAHADTVTFCLDRANPMVATDAAVAKAAGQAAGFTAVLVERDSAADAASGDDDDGPSPAAQRKYLLNLSTRCDVIMGVPVEAGHATLPAGMAASLAYARTGFVAASHAPIGDAARLPRNGQVGVLMLTPAMVYFDATDMSHEQVFYSNDALYGALLNGRIDTALIWQPWLNQQPAAGKTALHVAALPLPHAAWDIVAIHPVGQHAAAVAEFNRGVTLLANTPRLAAVVRPYAVPELKQ